MSNIRGINQIWVYWHNKMWFSHFTFQLWTSAFGQDGVTRTGFTFPTWTTKKPERYMKRWFSNIGWQAAQDSEAWDRENNWDEPCDGPLPPGESLQPGLGTQEGRGTELGARGGRSSLKLQSRDLHRELQKSAESTPKPSCEYWSERVCEEATQGREESTCKQHKEYYLKLTLPSHCHVFSFSEIVECNLPKLCKEFLHLCSWRMFGCSFLS